MQNIRSEMVADADRAGHSRRGASPRSRHRRAVRNRHALSGPGDDGRQRDDVQIRLQERRRPAWQGGDVHAQAAVPGQRLGDARSLFSLWKGDKPLFAGNKYAGLSEMGLYAIGGILKHARALCALCNPTTNSYKRLVPGYEAPVNLVYSSRNRSAAIRIPMYSEKPQDQADRIPLPRQLVQSVPGVQRDDDGRHRRDPKQDSTPATRWTRTSIT